MNIIRVGLILGLTGGLLLSSACTKTPCEQLAQSICQGAEDSYPCRQAKERASRAGPPQQRVCESVMQFGEDSERAVEALEGLAEGLLEE